MIPKQQTKVVRRPAPSMRRSAVEDKTQTQNIVSRTCMTQTTFVENGIIIQRMDGSAQQVFPYNASNLAFDMLIALIKEKFREGVPDVAQLQRYICPKCKKDTFVFNNTAWRCTACGYEIKHYER